MPYKPTGNPPGRPKTAKHAKDEPADSGLVLCPCGCGAYTDAPLKALTPLTRSAMPFSDAPCCPACHPNGWPEGWSGYSCEHGTWARRL